jgi:hypothetical protein
LAHLLRRRADSATRWRDPAYRKLWPAKVIEAEKQLLTANPDELLHEAEKLFERTIAEYGDVTASRGTLGQMAQATLFELHHLVVGKAAPDIEGEDIDGKKFKLSDYRGKIVLLDFWGHW